MTKCLFGVAVLTLAAACGGTTRSDPTPPACVAGATQTCLCVGGESGVQSCKDDGSGFLPCECSAQDSSVHDSSPGDTGSAKDSVADALDSSLADTVDSSVADTTPDTTVLPDTTPDSTADTFDGAVDASTDSGTGGSTYSETFTKGDVATAQCTAWDAWRASLSATTVYTKITVKGSADPVGKSCTDPGPSTPKANMLCQALLTGTSIGVPCGADAWNVGVGCGGAGVVGLSVNGAPCGCSTPSYTIRPCSGTADWGGIGGDTCGADSQTMTVTCE